MKRIGGFTVIELLIGIGALALVSVGVAAIFDATGRTVRAGKRVSAFNQYASLIERQLRADLSAATRDGFLIIRNEYADGDATPGVVLPPAFPAGQSNADCVPLDETDERPRLRRIDEIMFFAKGEFRSVRELMDPRFIARADAAAIYYGHGQKARAPVSFNQSHSYFEPSVGGVNTWTGRTDDPDARLGYPSTGAVPNPNRYASDWTLLRRVTLLRPEYAAPSLPNSAAPVHGVPIADQRLRDSDTQVSLQPATSNVFRALSSLFPTGTNPIVRQFDTARPQLVSGLVDIATTDLSMVRAIVTTADTWPGTPPAGFSGSAAGTSFFTDGQNTRQEGSNAGPDGWFSATNNVLARMQSWMDDGLPAWSTAGSGRATRVRYETSAPNYVGILEEYGPAPAGINDPLQLTARRADQLMLTSSNFLPRCTEFIVEWSFGVQHTSDPTNPNYDALKAGQLAWYGMPRVVNGEVMAIRYGLNLAPPAPAPSTSYPWSTPITVAYPRVDGTSGSHTISAALIHGVGAVASRPGDTTPTTSYFGFHDPLFNPDTDAPSGQTAPDGKLVSPQDSASPTIDWPWPRFVRVTLSLADPSDPSVEQTFQFVIEMPKGNR